MVWSSRATAASPTIVLLDVNRRLQLKDLSQQLAPANRERALSAFAGLQLDARNAHQLARLEAAAVAALRYAGGKQTLTPAELAKIVNEGSLFDLLVGQEDPAEQLFCEEVNAPGGGFLVGSGFCGNSVFYLRHVVTALFRQGWTNERVPERLLPVFRAALLLSDHLFRRAGVERGDVWEGEQHGQVNLGRVAELQGAVRFDLSVHELAEIVHALDPLVWRASETLQSDDPSRVAVRPFVLDGQHLIAAFPFEIASALIRTSVRVAIDEDARSEFFVHYGMSCAGALGRSLQRLGMEPLDPDDLPLPASKKAVPVIQSVYRFDDDKLAVAICAPDTLRDYDPDFLFQEHDASELGPLLAEHICEVVDALMGFDNTRVVFPIVALAPLDRGMFFELSLGELNGFVSSLSDLETFALAERGEPLSLWKFAGARHELQATTQVRAFSPLDLYEAYRSASASFAPAAGMELVVALPGGGGVMRADAAVRFDPHPVPHPIGVGVEVERWLPHAPSVPIYVPRESPRVEHEVVVETNDLTLWVVGDGDPGGEPLAHTIAYWLWQFADDVHEELAERADSNGVVEFLVSPGAYSPWRADVESDANGDGADDSEPFLRADKQDDRSLLAFELGRRAWSLFQSPDNRGERELVRGLLRLVVDDPDAHQRIDELVDRHVPLGYKKELMVAGGIDPRVDDRLLRPYRPVQPHDETRARLQISGKVIAGLGDRGLDPSDRQRTLHLYVGEAIALLREEAQRLSTEGLMERLVSCYEAVVHEQSFRELTLITKSLTYGGHDETLDERDHELVRLNRTAITSRFLIEFFAAEPPSGSTQFSTAAYDRLLGIACQVVEAGTFSDALHSGISDVVVAAHDGLIVFTHDDHAGGAGEAFIEARLRSEVEAERSPLEELVWAPDDDEPIEIPLDLDAALIEEFGLGLLQIAEFQNLLIERGIDEPGGVVVVSRQRIEAELVDDHHWTEASAVDAIDRFALSQRVAVDHAVPPFKQRDTFPWRMNRPLSYLSRPLVLRGHDLVYGVRHLFSAQKHLVDRISQGRYPAQSTLLRRYQGALGNARGEAFEDAVAGLYREHGYEALVRVKRLGGRHVARPSGDSLGDIDVLVADTVRRRLIAIDAKALGLAINFDDIASEINEVFGTDSSVVSKHLERCAWLRENRPAIASAFGEEASAWRIAPLIVTDRPLASPHFASGPIPVISYHDLRQELLAEHKL